MNTRGTLLCLLRDFTEPEGRRFQAVVVVPNKPNLVCFLIERDYSRLASIWHQGPFAAEVDPQGKLVAVFDNQKRT